MGRGTATQLGLLALGFWSVWAVLAVQSAPAPPLAVLAVAFGAGGAVGLIWVRGLGGRLPAIGLRVVVFGSAGLFGHHLLAVTALRQAPPVEAALLVQSWPLWLALIDRRRVPRSGPSRGPMASPGARLGGALGLTGLTLAIGPALRLGPEAQVGLLLAALAAASWTATSLVSRRLGPIPASSMSLFSLGAAAMAVICITVVGRVEIGPGGAMSPLGWIAGLALGLGPMGLAWLLWDTAGRDGDPAGLSRLLHAVPLLSTLVLLVAVGGPLRLVLAATLLGLGSAIASGDVQPFARRAHPASATGSRGRHEAGLRARNEG